MAYPNQSDFQSGEPLAAHWAATLPGGQLRRYASQGRSVVRRVQATLNNLNYRTGTAGNATPRSLTVDGSLGEHTMNALVSAAADHARADPQGGYGHIAEKIREDVAARRVSSLALRWALWLAYLRGYTQGVSWEHVTLPAGYRLPAYGVAPDDDRAASGPAMEAISWIEGIQAPPVPPARTPDATQRGAVGGTVTPPAQPQGGALAPVTGQVLAVGQQSQGFLEGTISGTGIPKWVAAGGGVALVLWFAWMMMKKKGRW